MTTPVVPRAPRMVSVSAADLAAAADLLEYPTVPDDELVSRLRAALTTPAAPPPGTLRVQTDVPGEQVSEIAAELVAALREFAPGTATVTLTGAEAAWGAERLGLGSIGVKSITIKCPPAAPGAEAGAGGETDG